MKTKPSGGARGPDENATEESIEEKGTAASSSQAQANHMDQEGLAAHISSQEGQEYEQGQVWQGMDED